MTEYSPLARRVLALIETHERRRRQRRAAVVGGGAILIFASLLLAFAIGEKRAIYADAVVRMSTGGRSVQLREIDRTNERIDAEGSAELSAAIETMSQDPDPTIRFRAASALAARWGSGEIASRFETIARGVPPDALPAEVTSAIAQSTSDPTDDHLAFVLTTIDKSATSREVATRFLGPALACIASGREDLAGAAWTAFDKIAPADVASSELARPILATLATGSSFARDRSLAFAKQRGVREVLPKILDLLHDADDDARELAARHAADFLPTSPDDGVVDALITALTDRSERVQFCAAKSLGGIDERRALEASRAALLRLIDAQRALTQSAALMELDRQNAPETIACARKLLLRRESSSCGSDACRVLGRHRAPIDPSDVEWLLNDSSTAVRTSAAFALAAAGHEDGWQRLQEIAAHGQYPSQRIDAIRMIANLGGVRAEKALESCKDDSDGRARAAAIQGIAGLRSQSGERTPTD